MNRRRNLMVWFLIPLFAVTAHAEKRAIAVSVSMASNHVAKVSIWSDEQSERRKDVSIDEASGVLRNLKDWGSVISVHVVCAERIATADLKRLVDAMAESRSAVDLSYIRNGGSGEWSEGFIRSRITEPQGGGYSPPAARPSKPTP